MYCPGCGKEMPNYPTKDCFSCENIVMATFCFPISFFAILATFRILSDKVEKNMLKS